MIGRKLSTSIEDVQKVLIDQFKQLGTQNEQYDHLTDFGCSLSPMLGVGSS